MSVKLLTEQHLEFQPLTGDCTGSSESTLVKMPHCWKSLVAAQIFRKCILIFSDKSMFQTGASLEFIIHVPNPFYTGNKSYANKSHSIK